MAGLNREWFGKITQAVMGHGGLRRHCFLRGEGLCPTCRLCSREPEEPGHLFWDCFVLVEDTEGLVGGFHESPDKVVRVQDFLKISRVRELLDTEDLPEGPEARVEILRMGGDRWSPGKNW